MHLSPDELLDVAEGTRREASLPHLSSCEICRRQIADLRAALSAAVSIGVPEPSPLFWNQFSIGVRDALATAPAGGGWRWAWARFHAPIVLAATPAILVLCVLGARLIGPHRQAPATREALGVAPPGTADTLATDDPAFTLVADLTGAIDVETAHEAGLAGQGSAEHAVTHLSQGELKQLQHLLREELANPSN